MNLRFNIYGENGPVFIPCKTHVPNSSAYDIYYRAADCQELAAVGEGIATGDWSYASDAVVRNESGRGFYPVPLLFASADKRAEETERLGLITPTVGWLTARRSEVLTHVRDKICV